jgi:hypothetical protein
LNELFFLASPLKKPDSLLCSFSVKLFYKKYLVGLH